MSITRKNIGDRFDDFLKEEGMYEECTGAFEFGGHPIMLLSRKKLKK